MDDARTIYETVLEGKRQLIDMEQKIRELEEGMQSVSKEEMESYIFYLTLKMESCSPQDSCFSFFFIESVSIYAG